MSHQTRLANGRYISVSTNSSKTNLNNLKKINKYNERIANLQNRGTNEKFNPDVINNYKNLEKIREKLKGEYKLNNTPYKTIIDDDISNKNISNHEDFRIKIETDNKDVTGKLEEIEKERNYDDTISKNIFTEEKRKEYEDKFKYRNVEMYKIGTDDDTLDYDELKGNMKQYYKRQEREFNKGKQKYNEILDSLLKSGILD